MSWQVKTLGELVTIKGGGTPSKKIADYWGGTIPWASVKDLKSRVLLNTEDSITELGVVKSATNVIPKGTIIVPTRMALGKVAITGCDMAINQDLKALIIVDNKQINQCYLARFLESKSSFIESEGKGATVKGITLDFLKSLEIPLPPLDEQKRIAAILDKADAIRQKRKQAISLADEFLRSVFLDMFGDPVTNPKGWEVRSIRDFITIQGGYAFKSSDFTEDGVPVVKIGNANKHGFTTKNIAFINPENSEKLKQYELYAGDLLMSLTGTVGKDDYGNITEVTNEFGMYYLNQRVAKITVKDSNMKSYLKFFFKHPKIKAEITKNNRGVRQANIGNSDIYCLTIPIPSNNALKIFEKIVLKARELQTKADSFPEQSVAMFNALSQKAFSGQL